MDVLQKLNLRTLQKNPKRTIVTIVGIILATALITGVASMGTSFRASIIAYEKVENGDYHYLFSGVKKENIKFFVNNRNIEKAGYVEEIGYALLEGSLNPDKPYLYLRAINEEASDAMSLKLVAGRLPEKEGEIVLSKHIYSNGGVDFQVGDHICLKEGYRDSNGEHLSQKNPYLYEEEQFCTVEEQEYEIVGIIERPSDNIEERMAPGYSAFIYLDSVEDAGSVEVYVSYTKRAIKHIYEATAGILGVSEDLLKEYVKDESLLTEEEYGQVTQVADAVKENYWLLKWELNRFSNSTMSVIYGMGGIAIVVIMITSVFCIRNSFMISLTEKMRLYGMLTSVGTTGKQRRGLVYREAVFLGCIGIPLGILCGLGAIAVLLHFVGALFEGFSGFPLKFSASALGIVLSMVLAGITILLSANKAARRAGKVSPITAIRGNETIKIGKKDVKCPRIVNRLWGIGGTIAYKNLRRCRVKYRTTIISIIVSVATFIAMTTFVNLGFKASTVYYDELGYQLQVYVDTENTFEDAKKIAQMEGVQKQEIRRNIPIYAESEKLPFTDNYKQYLGEDADAIQWQPINISALGEEGYENYCRELGVSVEEAKDKIILIADCEIPSEGKVIVDDIVKMYPGDVIEAVFTPPEEMEDAEEDKRVSLEVLMQTSVRPMWLKGKNYYSIMGIVSDEWMEQYINSGELPYSVVTAVYIQCEDSDKLENAILQEFHEGYVEVYNEDAQYRSTKNFYMLLAIFLYGFIGVIALIGITNIFNTITTNMELRSREFAMLKTIGMTRKEFRRMVQLESVFYGVKSLLLGIPIGIVISYGFHKALAEGIEMSYQVPYSGICLSVMAVFLLIFGIMHYSMKKIQRKNMLETIQNENI